MFGFFQFTATIETQVKVAGREEVQTRKSRVCLNPLEVKAVRETPQPEGAREGYTEVIHATGEYVSEEAYPVMCERWRKACEEHIRMMKGDNGQIA